MIENNNGQLTPRFFEDDHLRKNNKSSPVFKKNLVPLCKEEKPLFVSYKPKTKKYYTAYDQINNKKENLQFISDVATSYKFIENFRNKDLIDTAFKIDKDKQMNSSQTNEFIHTRTGNNFQNFYQTISNFKSKNLIPPLPSNNLNNTNQRIHPNSNTNSDKVFSKTQNNFLPKHAKMYHRKRINLESKNISNNRNPTQSDYLRNTKSTFKNCNDNGDLINISSSDEENNVIINITKKKKPKNALNDIELKFDNFDSTNKIYNNNSPKENNFKINDAVSPNSEFSEKETKFFKKYLNYIEYIKKKRLNSPEIKQNQDLNADGTSNNFLKGNNLSPIIRNSNNGNYKEFHVKNNFNKIDISPFDIDIVEFRNAIAKSAEIVINSLKGNNTRMVRLIDIERAKKKIFKEIGQNNIFEKLLDKVFRRVIYVSDKNTDICEDFVVNLIHNEIGQLTARNTSVPSDQSNRKTTSGSSKLRNNLPPIMKKGTASSSNSQYGLSENVFNSRGKIDSKQRSRLDLKGALSPIGEIEMDNDIKMKNAHEYKDLTNKDLNDENNIHEMDNHSKKSDANINKHGQFYNNYKNNFQQQFDGENNTYNSGNYKIPDANNLFFNKYFNNNKNLGYGQYEFLSSKSLSNSFEKKKSSKLENEEIETKNKTENNLEIKSEFKSIQHKNIFKPTRPRSPDINAFRRIKKFVYNDNKLINFDIDGEEKKIMAYNLRRSKWNFTSKELEAIRKAENIINNFKKNKYTEFTEDDQNGTLNSDKESMRFIKSNVVKKAVGDKIANHDLPNLLNNNGNDVNKHSINNTGNASYGVSNFLESKNTSRFFNSNNNLAGNLNSKISGDISNTNLDSSKKSTGLLNNAQGFKKGDNTLAYNQIPEEKETGLKNAKDSKGKAGKGGKAATGHNKLTSKDDKNKVIGVGKKGGALSKKGKKTDKDAENNNEAKDEENNENENKEEIIEKGESNKDNLDNKSKFTSGVSLLNPLKDGNSSGKKDSVLKSVFGMKGKLKNSFAILDSEGNDIIDNEKSKRRGSSLNMEMDENNLYEMNGDNIEGENKDNKSHHSNKKTDKKKIDIGELIGKLGEMKSEDMAANINEVIYF